MMSNQETETAISGGAGMGSSNWLPVILVVIVLWLLFTKDNHNDGGHYGHGFAPQGGTLIHDMPDYLVDRDVLAQGCQTRETEVCQAEKTRALIVHNQERADDRAYQALILQNLQKDNFIQTLQLENSINGKIAGVYGEIEKGFCGTNAIIAKLDCDTVKRPPFYAMGGEPTIYPYPSRGCGCGDKF